MSKSFDRFMPKTRQSLFAWLAVAAVAFAVVRIAISYHAMSQTWDETGHITAGMQFVDQGKYTYETLHPTVGRAATAILPYLDGARSHNNPLFWNEGNEIIHAQGTYWRTMTLARLGILPFFLLGALMLWKWSRKLFGDVAAFFTVLFYSLVPPILAHAGLATTDIPLAGCFLASCYALWWFLDSVVPNSSVRSSLLTRAIVFGAVLGFTASTKFSFLFFFPPTALIIIAFRFFAVTSIEKNPNVPYDWQKNLSSEFLNLVKAGGLILFAALFTIWTCFGFSYGPVPITNRTLGVTYEQGGSSYLAPEFISGINSVIEKNGKGQAVYFWGKDQYNHGSPWFFPVALGVKTPVAMLLLIAFAVYLIFAVRKGEKMDKRWRTFALLPLVISAVMLAMVIPSNINIGIRHILVIYPFLAMLAGLGAEQLWTKFGIYGRVTLAVLLVWTVASSVSNDPDRLAYFNEFASNASAHPVLLDSDLDWGQDLDRLADTLRARGITSISLDYFGQADYAQHGFTGVIDLRPNEMPQSEWTAISKFDLYTNDGFAWLRSETPAVRIGNSMLLYHFAPADFTRLRSTHSGGSGGMDIGSAETLAAKSPSPENYLNLSLAYFRSKRFNECIAAARKAISLRPNDPTAYNNIAAGFMGMSEYDSAITAAAEAVRLNPDFTLAKNNLTLATQGKKDQQAEILKIEKIVATEPTPKNYLSLSAAYFSASQFEKSITAARKAIALRPDFAGAYNNLCAANNSLGHFAEGKKAGEQAVRLDPSSQLYKNNLNQSVDGLNKK